MQKGISSFFTFYRTTFGRRLLFKSIFQFQIFLSVFGPLGLLLYLLVRTYFSQKEISQ